MLAQNPDKIGPEKIGPKIFFPKNFFFVFFECPSDKPSRALFIPSDIPMEGDIVNM